MILFFYFESEEEQTVELTGPRYLIHCLCNFDLGQCSSKLTSFPSPTSNLSKELQNRQYSISNYVVHWFRHMTFALSVCVCVPIEEWLLALAVEPAVVVEVQVVAIPMSRVNLTFRNGSKCSFWLLSGIIWPALYLWRHLGCVWFVESPHTSWGGASWVHSMNFSGTNSFLMHILIVILWGMSWWWINSFHSTNQIQQVRSEKTMDHPIPQTKHTLIFLVHNIPPRASAAAQVSGPFHPWRDLCQPKCDSNTTHLSGMQCIPRKEKLLIQSWYSTVQDL
jgi:hypothetical protein